MLLIKIVGCILVIVSTSGMGLFLVISLKLGLKI